MASVARAVAEPTVKSECRHFAAAEDPGRTNLELLELHDAERGLPVLVVDAFGENLNAPREELARLYRGGGITRERRPSTRPVHIQRPLVLPRRIDVRAGLGHAGPMYTSSFARLPFDSDERRIESFGGAIDAIGREVEADLGEKDAAHIDRIGLVSRSAEVVGRVLLHFSIEPFAFGLGVGVLWLHKSLELMEIGHMALHGAYDRFPTASRYHADVFRWKAPIDEPSWRVAHNVRHHQYTNVEGRDPDMNFGVLRLSPRVPHRRAHSLQPVTNLASWFGFATAINLHVTGMLDVYFEGDKPQQLRDKSAETVRVARHTFFSKFARYYGREYVFFPLLAGPFFWKVLLGNILSEVGRDLYSAAVIYCGHVGAKDFPSGTRAKGRARWYVMQVEAARNIEVPHLVSILCGGLDRQIEHHLFPRLPPNRLREIAPRVRAVCEAHGVRYLSKGWFSTLREVVGELRNLSLPTAVPLDAVV